MKKNPKQNCHDEMRDHYDFSGGVRGKHAKRYAQGTNLVVLAPDVLEVFKDANSVNAALRGLIELAKKTKAAGERNVGKKRAAKSA
jgi:hypothetical protein